MLLLGLLCLTQIRQPKFPVRTIELKKKKKKKNQKEKTRGPVHSGTASWDDCGWAFPNKLPVSLFPWWVFPLCLGIVSPTPPCWHRSSLCMFGCNYPLAYLAEWQVFYVLLCQNWGERDTEIRVTKSWLDKNILQSSSNFFFLLLLLGTEPTTFWSQSLHCTGTAELHPLHMEHCRLHLSNSLDTSSQP